MPFLGAVVNSGPGYVRRGFIRSIAFQFAVDGVVGWVPRNSTHVTPNIHVDSTVGSVTNPNFRKKDLNRNYEETRKTREPLV